MQSAPPFAFAHQTFRSAHSKSLQVVQLENCYNFLSWFLYICYRISRKGGARKTLYKSQANWEMSALCDKTAIDLRPSRDLQGVSEAEGLDGGIICVSRKK